MSKEINVKACLLPFITSAFERDGWKIDAKFYPAKELSYYKESDGISVQIKVTELDDSFSISFGSIVGLSKPTRIENYFEPKDGN